MIVDVVIIPGGVNFGSGVDLNISGSFSGEGGSLGHAWSTISGRVHAACPRGCSAAGVFNPRLHPGSRALDPGARILFGPRIQDPGCRVLDLRSLNTSKQNNITKKGTTINRKEY